MRRAASSCMVGITWLYRSSVNATLAWPSISEAIFGFTPAESISVAAVCRRSWNRIRGSPAAFRSGRRLVRPERRNVGLLVGAGDDAVGAPDGIAIVRPLEGDGRFPAGWILRSTTTARRPKPRLGSLGVSESWPRRQPVWSYTAPLSSLWYGGRQRSARLQM